MLNQAWKDYQAWAKLARDLQVATGRWNVAALFCVAVAALCVAATTLFPAGPDKTGAMAAGLAGAAALAAAVGAFFGREILGSGDEANWIQARATAEAIKSECFRYAARAGAYAGADDVEAAQALDRRTRDIAQQARDKGLVPADRPFETSAGNPMPRAPMDKAWYKANRIGDEHRGQIKYYLDARKKQERRVQLLWWVAFVVRLFGRRLRSPWCNCRPAFRALDRRHDDDRRRDRRLGPSRSAQASDRELCRDAVEPRAHPGDGRSETGEPARSGYDDRGSARQRTQGLAASDARHATPAARATAASASRRRGKFLTGAGSRNSLDSALRGWGRMSDYSEVILPHDALQNARITLRGRCATGMMVDTLDRIHG